MQIAFFSLPFARRTEKHFTGLLKYLSLQEGNIFVQSLFCRSKNSFEVGRRRNCHNRKKKIKGKQLHHQRDEMGGRINNLLEIV